MKSENMMRRQYTEKPVLDFYKEHHMKQTLAYAKKMRKSLKTPRRKKLTIIQALEMIDELFDESDPDISMGQIHHALQTSEAIRKECPELDWFILVGLIHDLGKILQPLYGLPQWSVVGDTYPCGVRFSDKIVCNEYLRDNPDYKRHGDTGIYEKGCGFGVATLTYGHDEYLFRVLQQAKTKLPREALYIVRFHSFYPWHEHGAYAELADQTDRDNLHWLKRFNEFDLYTKENEKVDWPALKPYYVNLIEKYIPGSIWF